MGRSHCVPVLSKAFLPAPLVFLPPPCGQHAPEEQVGLHLESGLWDHKIGGASPSYRVESSLAKPGKDPAEPEQTQKAMNDK